MNIPPAVLRPRQRRALPWVAFAAVGLLAACSQDAPTPFSPYDDAFLPQMSSHTGPRTLHAITKSGGDLYTIDAATGATLTGPLGITIPNFTVGRGNGLATDPTTGTLYALVRGFSGDSHLITVDPVSGVGAMIGDLGDKFSGIAFTCDALYGVTGDGASDSESFYRIDRTTAVTTFLMALGNGTDGEAIAFNPDDGLMYHASGFAGGEIWESIDLNTLTVTPIVGPAATDYREAFGLTYDAAGTFLVTGISDGLGTLTTGGAEVRLGDVDREFKGLAFIPTFSCNEPPVAHAGDDQSVEWTSAAAGATTLNGSGSSDPDGDLLTYTWMEGATVLGTTTDPVATLTVNLSLGVHTITLTVEDGHGETDTDDVEITVEDTTAPTVLAALVPVADKSLKSKKGHFTVEFSCADDCDPDAAPTATLNGIPVENGQVVDLRLKSAKSDKGGKSAKSEKSEKSKKSKKSEKPVVMEGPSFELVVICVDASGNEGTATASAEFAVKSEKSKKG